MSGFFYYLPGFKGTPSPKILGEYGLAHIIDRGDIIRSRTCLRGPLDSGAGIVCGNGKNFSDTEMKFFKDQQWWWFPKTHAQRRAIVGIHGEFPEPADLERDRVLPGGTVQDERGGSWTLPVARKMTTDAIQTMLPTTITIDPEEGTYLYGTVLRRYRPLWDKVEAFWAQMRAAADKTEVGQTFEVKDEIHLVAAAYQTNYRVSEMELSLLELLTTDSFSDVIDIVIDISGLTELKKSPALDTGDSSSGATPLEPEESVENITQPLQTT